MLSTALAISFFANPVCAISGKESKGVDPNALVAKVDDVKVTMTDLAQLFQSLPPQLQQVPVDKAYPALQNQLVDMVIMSKQAKKSGLEKDAEVKKAVDLALERIKQQILVQAYIEKNVTISDAEIRSKYEERKSATKDEQEAKASHILVKTEEEAKAIIKLLEGGAKFEKLAHEKSLDKASAKNGGDLGYFGQADMVPEFTAAVFALKNGKYSKDPIKTKFGYHVILKKDQRKMKPPALEEVRDLLKARLMQDKVQKMTRELRKNYKIELYAMDGKKLEAGTAPDQEKPKA